MMSTQLYNDAVVPSHHKYSAHQVALLYVSSGAAALPACTHARRAHAADAQRQTQCKAAACRRRMLLTQACVLTAAPPLFPSLSLPQQSLNMLQGDTKPIRRLIEARFDEIKAITEGGRPTLPPDAATWLQQVTWVCREEVAACPAYIHKRLAPLVTMLKAGCQRSSSGGGGDAAAAAQQPQAAVGLAAAAAQQQQSVYGAPAQQQQSCAVQEQQQATNYYQQQHYQAYSAAAH